MGDGSPDVDPDGGAQVTLGALATSIQEESLVRGFGENGSLESYVVCGDEYVQEGEASVAASS